MKKYRFLAVSLAVFALIFAQGAIGQTAMGPLRPEGVAMSDAHTPQPVKVMVGRNDVPPFQVAAPADFAEQPKTATFTIQYLNAGESNYFGDVCVGWPADAQAAFTYAANVWGTLINSPVPIKISACWANMNYISTEVLGHGGARSYYKDFTGVPQASTFYPVAVANALHGSDLNGSNTEEIVIAYNAQFTGWYFGTGTCPADKIDFAQVIMHEMCHGLGFLGSMYSDDSRTASWGESGYPLIYDRHTENAAGTKLITYTSGSAALYNQLVSGKVYFNGANANAGNGGARVKLYAPNPWQQGSSYSHLDEIFNGTPNAMMTYSVDFGSTIHDPGPVTMGILKDNGWTTGTPSPVVPTIKANDTTGTITVNYPTPVSITVAMNAGSYAGIPVDWWVLAFAHTGQWVYMNSAFQLVEFNGNPASCHPLLQAGLGNIPFATVLDGIPLARGTYDFWFAISCPMTGILNPSGAILSSMVTVNVQ